MKSARAKMKAALNEQARHARGEPTQEDREREKYKRYSQSDKGKARYQTYWSSDKGKQVLKQYKTSRKTQQKDDRTKVMELRDAALSIGRPVRDVAPSGKGQTKSKWSQNAVAMKTALDQQARSAQGKAAVDIWDMESATSKTSPVRSTVLPGAELGPWLELWMGRQGGRSSAVHVKVGESRASSATRAG